MNEHQPLQTQTFTTEVETAYRELSYLAARQIREITFASLNEGTIDPKEAKKAANKAVPRATKAFQQILDNTPKADQAKTLARILAELTVSETETWVVATHTAINGHMPGAGQ
ncbi:hypothetical protein [Isoptericola haloaureus]|uniref:Uncharacterized protein n=1 Tax=Isoptericola haloaureus TaxID=1542902 RepID=A0ABU7Z7T4_9MICO